MSKQSNEELRGSDPIGYMASQMVVAAFAAALVAAGAFIVIFWRLPWGGPADWGTFGDYFGGVVGALVAVATAGLVFLTLQTTRREARDTRKKMDDQLELLSDQQRLTDLHRRLEGVMAEWRLLIEEKKFDGYADPRISNSFVMSTWKKLFANPKATGHALQWKFDSGDGAVREDLREQFSDAVQLLGEVQLYCESYDRIARNQDLTDFYRRRVANAIRLLGAWGLVTKEFRLLMFVESIDLAAAMMATEP